MSAKREHDSSLERGRRRGEQRTLLGASIVATLLMPLAAMCVDHEEDGRPATASSGSSGGGGASAKSASSSVTTTASLSSNASTKSSASSGETSTADASSVATSSDASSTSEASTSTSSSSASSSSASSSSASSSSASSSGASSSSASSSGEASASVSASASSSAVTSSAMSSVASSSSSEASTSASSSSAPVGASSSDAGSSTASGASSSSGTGGGEGGAGPETLRIAVIGDYGLDSPGANDVAAMVASFAPDQVLTVGDNAYSADPEPYDPIVGKLYHAFIGGYAGAWGSGSVTNHFWPILGNHDVDHLLAYLTYFSLPGNERYYDTFLDPSSRVHLFGLDSDDREPDGNTVGSAQATWLMTASAADATSCFKIVTLHQPPFASVVGESPGPKPAVQWPFAAWGADLVMSGDTHAYERLSNDGIPYLVDGIGGGSLWGEWAAIDPHSVFRFPTTPQRFGAVLLSITIDAGIGTLRGELWAVNPGGTPDAAPADVFTIVKACP